MIFYSIATFVRISSVSDRKIPKLFENVVAGSLQVDVEVVLEKAVDHLLEGAEVRQQVFAFRIFRPEKLFARITLDKTFSPFDVNLNKYLKESIKLFFLRNLK